jgi:chitinase
MTDIGIGILGGGDKMLRLASMRLLALSALGAICIFLLAGCSKDDYKPVVPGEPETPTVPAAIAGRVACAYVTYYGTWIPDPAYLTNICYAFAELRMTGGVYDGFSVRQESRFAGIAALKKAHPSLKIQISFTNGVEISGNSFGGGFSKLAASDEARRKFAEDCLAFCTEWGIDGVDMDWEFPGMAWGSEDYDEFNDVANFVLLMKQLRETLGPDRLLTYAGYVFDKRSTKNGGWRYVDIAATAPYVDYVNIMTYDMGSAPHHHSAWSDSSCYCDCVRAVRSYLDAGMPASKLVLGIPFYGRHSFSVKPTAYNYSTIIALSASEGYSIGNWDASANVPFVTLNGAFFCGYDDARSIAAKGALAIGDKGMKGMMYWNYDADDDSGTLRKAVWNAVMKSY